MTALADSDSVLQWTRSVLGYEFKDSSLCLAALTHRSAAAAHNERLEFLGDSVLNCAVAQLLFDAHARADEGALSRLRASLVSGEVLAQIAAEHHLGDYLRLGSGELNAGDAALLERQRDALQTAISVMQEAVSA